MNVVRKNWTRCQSDHSESDDKKLNEDSEEEDQTGESVEPVEWNFLFHNSKNKIRSKGDCDGKV